MSGRGDGRSLAGRILLFLGLAVPALLTLAVASLFVLTLFGTPVDIYDSIMPDPTDVGCDGEQPGPAALVAFDTTSGELAWSRRVGSSHGMAVVDDVIVVGNDRGVIRGIDGARGDQLWCNESFEDSGDPSSAMPGQIASANGVVATISGRTLVGLDPVTGEALWQTDLGSADDVQPSPASTIAYVSEARLLGGSRFLLTTGGADGTGSTPIDPDDGTVLAPLVATPHTDANSVELEGFRLTTETPWREGRQETDVTVTDIDDGEDVWSATVPGYKLALHPRADGALAVLAIDQTGGTGRVFGDTLLTAYDIADGSVLWQRPVPITTNELVQAEPGMVIVTAGTELFGVDLETGESVWSADHGSPGRGRPWRVDGNYRQVEKIDDGTIVVGRIVAERPYRD